MLCQITSYFITLNYIVLYSSLIHSFAAAKALMFEAFQRSLDVDAKHVSMPSKLLETFAIM